MRMKLIHRTLAPGLLVLALVAACDSESRESASLAPIPVQGELLDAPEPAKPEVEVADASTAAGQFGSPAPASDPAAEGADPNAYDFEPPPAPPPLLAAPADPAAPAPSAPPAIEPTLDKEGFLELTFVNLGGWEYVYPPDEEIAKMPEEPDGSTLASFPEHIQELNTKKISIQGYMIPADVIEGKVKSFILINNQMGCCFGVMPLMNEWIYVTMAGDKTTEFMPDIPLKVKGEFRLGESVREGMVVSIYRMFGESVTAMPAKFDRALGF